MDQTGGIPKLPSDYIWVGFYAGPCDGDRIHISATVFHANRLNSSDCILRRKMTTLERQMLEDAGALFEGIEFINHVYIPHPRRAYEMLYSHSFAFQP